MPLTVFAVVTLIVTDWSLHPEKVIFPAFWEPITLFWAFAEKSAFEKVGSVTEVGKDTVHADSAVAPVTAKVPVPIWVPGAGVAAIAETEPVAINEMAIANKLFSLSLPQFKIR